MSTKKFKAGDKLRCVSVTGFLKKGAEYVASEKTTDSFVKIDGVSGSFWHQRFELVVPEKPKGTFETLVIESHPQGGYSVVAPGRHWGSEKATLAAFTTVDEALKFAGENLK